MSRCIFILLAIVVGEPTNVMAQARQGGVTIRVGTGLGITSTSVGGEQAIDAGPVLQGQIGMVMSPRSELTADVTVQPFKAGNPVADESFTAIYSTLGLQVGLGSEYRTYLRPELGLVFRSWSGSEVFVSSETSLAAGVALGREISMRNKLGLAPEVFMRLSGAEELISTVLGISFNVVLAGARQTMR